MKFPELKIIDKVPNKSRNTDEAELYLVHIDWSGVDTFKAFRKKDWHKKFSIDNPTIEQSEALTQILDETDWLGDLIYPQKYKWVFDKYSNIKMPKSYYEECLYLSKKSVEEWNRSRPFDTNVREELLSPAISFAESFFYLICDAIYIYNSDQSHNSDFFFEGSILFRSLMLYRFWKFQTGGALLYDKSTRFIKNTTVGDKFDEEVKEDLISNIKFDVFDDSIKILVDQRVRDNKLKNILS